MDQGHPQGPHEVKFTVHNYTRLRSTPFTAPSPTDLLSLARNLIEFSNSRSKQDDWEYAADPIPPNTGSGNCFVYKGTPPFIKPNLNGSNFIRQLKEWGSPVIAEEVWHLAALEEFISTPLEDIFKPRPEPTVNKRRHSSTEVVGIALPPMSTPPLSAVPVLKAEPLAKRRKLDVGSLHATIPQPHIHPSRLLGTTSAESSTLREYKRTTPIVLAPYTHPLPPPSTYGRRAWIIPVRGSLPWTGCTPAIVLDATGHMPAGPAQCTLDPIVWSRKALQAFWEFLISLQAGGRAGLIGFSFHPAEDRSDKGSANASSGAHAHGPSVRMSTEGQNPGNPDPTATVRSGQLSGTGDDGPSLASADFIKVYHEATKSMLVRTALDVWTHRMRDDAGVVVEKVRVLKWAKFVLMDHLSCGMLIS